MSFSADGEDAVLETGRASRRTLLLLEDLPEMREWLRAEIGSWLGRNHPGWGVRVADSSVSLLLELERERPALALLDEVLGSGDGIGGLLPRLKSLGVPFLLMTSATKGGRELPVGALARLTKPLWKTGAGIEAFLNELGQVMALTERGKIG